MSARSTTDIQPSASQCMRKRSAVALLLQQLTLTSTTPLLPTLHAMTSQKTGDSLLVIPGVENNYHSLSQSGGGSKKSITATGSAENHSDL